MADIHYIHKRNETDPYRNWMHDGESEMAGYLPPDPDRVIYAQRPRIPRADKSSPIVVIVIGILAMLAAIGVVSAALQVTL